MGEMIWCAVNVKVPRKWCNPITASAEAPWFVNDISAALCNGYGPEAHEVTDEYVIWHCDGEGNYGLSDSDVTEALDILRELRIPYTAHSDPKYEFSGETYIYDGNAEGTCTSRVSDADGQVVFTESQWLNLKGSTDEQILACLRMWFDVPNVKDQPIDHLPTECPSRDDEKEDIEDMNAVL